jgi:hypothetical protein
MVLEKTIIEPGPGENHNSTCRFDATSVTGCNGICVSAIDSDQSPLVSKAAEARALSRDLLHPDDTDEASPDDASDANRSDGEIKGAKTIPEHGPKRPSCIFQQMSRKEDFLNNWVREKATTSSSTKRIQERDSYRPYIPVHNYLHQWRTADDYVFSFGADQQSHEYSLDREKSPFQIFLRTWARCAMGRNLKSGRHRVG